MSDRISTTEAAARLGITQTAFNEYVKTHGLAVKDKSGSFIITMNKFRYIREHRRQNPYVRDHIVTKIDSKKLVEQLKESLLNDCEKSKYNLGELGEFVKLTDIKSMLRKYGN